MQKGIEKMVTEGLSVKELLSIRKGIRNINIEHKEKLSRLDEFAGMVTSKVGTMGFFLIIFGWTVCWLSWNLFAPMELRFDPYPAFVLWLFISNMIQIMLMPLLLVGQNLQGRHSEARAESDYEVNVQSEREIGYILKLLEEQNEVNKKILKQLEKNK